MPGHVGIIYQAHNGLYLGRSRPKTLLLGPRGRVMSARALSKIRNQEQGAHYATEQLLSMGCPPPRVDEAPGEYVRRAVQCLRHVRHPGNHGYVWPLRRRKDLRLTMSIKPYPKAVDTPL